MDEVALADDGLPLLAMNDDAGSLVELVMGIVEMILLEVKYEVRSSVESEGLVADAAGLPVPVVRL